jgi:hypothetical protein
MKFAAPFIRRKKMKAIRVFMALLIAAAGLASLTTCKPITYYLEQVYKVYGKVTDAQTGDPLESVEVFVKGYQYSELTNGLGDYEIELAEGTWTLEFAKEGYETAYSEPFQVGPSAQRIEVNAALTAPTPTILGYWNFLRAYAKYTGVIQFAPGGVLLSYEDYAGTIVGDTGSWSQSGDIFTIVIGGAAPMSFPIQWITANQFQFPGPFGTVVSYRKGFEPDGYLFNNPKYPPITLAKNTEVEGNLPSDGIDIYQYTAGANAQNTVISWKDFSNSPGYFANLIVWVYADETTLAYPLGSPPSPINVALTPGHTYYIVLANHPLFMGNYTIKVEE